MVQVVLEIQILPEVPFHLAGHVDLDCQADHQVQVNQSLLLVQETHLDLVDLSLLFVLSPLFDLSLLLVLKVLADHQDQSVRVSQTDLFRQFVLFRQEYRLDLLDQFHHENPVLLSGLVNLEVQLHLFDLAAQGRQENLLRW